MQLLRVNSLSFVLCGTDMCNMIDKELMSVRVL